MRVTIVLGAESVEAWKAQTITELQKLSSVELTICVLNAPLQSTSKAFQLFKKLDAALLSRDFNYSKLTSISMATHDGKITLDNLNSLNEGLIINLSKTSLSVPARNHEVWQVMAGDGNAFGFWEWLNKRPITPISIICNQSTIRNTIVKTETLSYSRNETAVCAKTIDLIVQSVKDLTKSPVSMADSRSSEKTSSRHPGFVSIVAACAILIFRLLLKSFRKIIRIEQWIVCYSNQQQLLPELQLSVFKKLIPPKDRIWADPFVITQSHKHYIFIEEMPLSTRRGHLSCLILNQEGEIIESGKILEQPYHLSYPFVFQQNDQWFMIPESGENKTVDLYECLSFPFEWKFKKNLLNGFAAYDSTHFIQGGIHWIFCTIQTRIGGSTNDELHLFYSDDIFNDWTPHPLNPLVSNPFTARPAGKLFVKAGMLYRPSQICVPRYGYGISLNRITKLSKTEYCEVQDSIVEPNWEKNILATHTLNSSGSLTVVDALVKRPRFF